MAAALYHVKKRIVFGPEGAETMYFCHAREQGHESPAHGRIAPLVCPSTEL